MAKYTNTVSLIGTYGGKENVQDSMWAVCDTGNFIVKTADRIFADIGNVINYTIGVITGENVADDLHLVDAMDDGLEFVEGSLIVDGVAKTCTLDEYLSTLTFVANTSYDIKYQAIRVTEGN